MAACQYGLSGRAFGSFGRGFTCGFAELAVAEAAAVPASGTPEATAGVSISITGLSAIVTGAVVK
jgi:hypothetical protein